jgi:hypothetical protein
MALKLTEKLNIYAINAKYIYICKVKTNPTVMETALFYAIIIIFFTYTLFIWIFYGIQESMSDSYYALRPSERYLFTLFCWGFALPLIIISVNVSGLMFLAGAGILFVGAAPRLLIDHERRVHLISAITGIVASQCAIFFGYKYFLINVFSIVAAILIFFLVKKNRIWWIEIVAFIAIMMSVFLKRLN